MKATIILSLLIFNSCTISLTTIYNQSEDFIDIEVNKENFYMECGTIDKKERKSLMIFYAINKDVVYKFNYRRISETGWCKKNIRKEYDKLIKNISKIRLVETTPLEKEKNYLINRNVPEKLKIPNSLVSWTFIRLETSKGCKSYFQADCSPNNYWGGLLPQG